VDLELLIFLLACSEQFGAAIGQHRRQEGPSPALRRPLVRGRGRALCLSLNAVIGFTNRSLCADVSRLLGQAYTVHQMSYDLGRFRLNGLIDRLDGTNSYTLTPAGQRVATS
jgi:hypothetical protein